MESSLEDQRRCRTCGRPRGVNIAHGTRCARCGWRHAVILWIGSAFAAGEWTLFYGGPVRDAVTSSVVTLACFPVAIVSAVLVHELSHAFAGRFLGQTVTRVLVGEGRAVVRFGRDPELVFGSVTIGNGLATIMDLRIDAYRARMIVMLLCAPLVSLAIGETVWLTTAGWPVAFRTAARVFAAASLALGAVTLVPTPTFGGRVWSDLAAARHLWHATDDELVEHMLLSAQDRVAILLERGEAVSAVDTARRAMAAAPHAPLAHSLLAFTLLQIGRRHEAASVARSALAGPIDDVTREYLTKLVEEADREQDG